MEGGASCISCGVWKDFSELDGGHFIPTTSSAIRFDERNINGQCFKCNRFLHGNPRHYLRGMQRKYGEGVVADLEALEHTTKKWTREELIEIRNYYNEKLKDLRMGRDPNPAPEMDMHTMFVDLSTPESVSRNANA